MHLRLNKLTNHLFLTFQFGEKHRKRWKRNGRKTSRDPRPRGGGGEGDEVSSVYDLNQGAQRGKGTDSCPCLQEHCGSISGALQEPV